MKPERAFVAERPIARHCPELLRAQPQEQDSGAFLERFAERLGDALASGFAGLAGGELPSVTNPGPRSATMQDIASPDSGLACWSLFASGRADSLLLARSDGTAILRLVDRAFGGTGSCPESMPDAFPLSADLFIGRMEAMLASALTEAAAGGKAIAFRQVQRETCADRMTAIPQDEPLAVLEFEIADEATEPWKLMLALPASAQCTIAGNAPPDAQGHAGRSPPSDPSHEPFASLPLTLDATLVDMRIGFSKLAGLRPGDVLPVAVARRVPLRIGERTIAHGTVGEMDDRVAVRITQAF